MKTETLQGGNCNDDSSSNNSSELYRLSTKLLEFGFGSFQMAVVMWLNGIGCRHMRVLGRWNQRGRHPYGGADFVVKWPESEIDVAVQIRHWRTPVTRRSVDELRGFMLRHGLPAGLIIARSGYADRAAKAARRYPGRPIEFLTCLELAKYFLRHPSPTTGSRVADCEFDRFLRSVDSIKFAGSNAQSAGGPPKASMKGMIGRGISVKSEPAKFRSSLAAVLLPLGILLLLLLVWSLL